MPSNPLPPSPSPRTPSRPHTPTTSREASPPPSPFSATPSSLARPSQAHLPSQPIHLSRASPLGLHTRGQPHSALSDGHASVVDLYRADGTAYSPPREGPPARERGSIDVQRSATEPSVGRAAVRGAGERRSSVGSLQSLVERDEALRSASAIGGGGGFEFLRRAGSRQSSGAGDLPPIEDDAGEDAKNQLGQLSWGTKWWPFSVVEPEGSSASTSSASPSAGTAPTATSRDAPPFPPAPPSAEHDASMSLLSLFAGKKSVSDAHATQAEVALSDAIDTALLDEADLQELQRRVREIPTPSAMEADEVPAKEAGGGGAAAKAASFLPSLWAAPTAQKSSEKAKASLARITDHAVASEAKSPATLLSSFTLSNPFTSSSTSAGSLFSMAPFASSSSRPSSRSHTRSFSSSSMSRRRSTGSADMDERPAGKHGDEQGSELGKNHVKGMVDELDRQAVEEGVEENDDMYAVLKDKYTAPRLPVVFCHGLFGFDHIGPASLKPLRFSYWVGVEEALQAMGAEVMIGRVPASASVEERAKVLCEMIEERFPGREVNLVGHSMGGLDGRYLISRLKPKSFTVRSLTTISTPHRGSSFADFLLEDILGAEKVPSFLALMRGLGVPGGGKAFDDLTTTKMARFNEDTPDDPNVKYYSYGAEFTASWSNPFYIPFGIIRQREGPNDGLVSVSSAQWGEYRATLHNVNHLDLVGWVGKVRYGFAELMGRPIKFKPISFYCAIAEQLAEEGF